MSDSKKRPKDPPPDDFSKTVLNIDSDEEDSGDWDKTSYNNAPDAPADDWGKTVINYDSSLEEDNPADDFGAGSGRSGSSEQPDWGMTQTNVHLGDDFEAEEEFGEDEVDTAATKHVIHIPELDRKKFKIPPTPTEKIEQERKEKRKSGGVPTWFWVSAGLMTLFFISLVIIGGVWLALEYWGRDYEVVVIGAPADSRFFLDNEGEWGVSSTGNSHVLSGLKPGDREIIILSKTRDCEPIPIALGEGNRSEQVTAICRPKANTDTISEKACDETRVVEDREKCAEQILDTLGNPPDLDRLVKALNWLIINFEPNKYDIPDARKRILTKAAIHIKNLPDSVKIEVGGHTDSDGTPETNQPLSENRAKAVRDFLVNIADVPPARLETKGYGEDRPKASNDTEEGKFDNRRIEYTVISR
ncbi:MAG: OmpA family protein [Acidobacteria bacterium]|nr:MAG: OmpA family protein [Acidobacteriota bacterium]REJ98100.1 MAG: OmpA family protein [Acidobacteriota bacterium]REK16843.1 MAG: OmpA family protein [Acidobacteriota bacterium]REK42754.1 MAG: OmpA family protein [Acidobacteriota bacterium]